MGEKFKSSSGSTSVPTLTIPPRESFFIGGPTFSPGPVTLISTFLSDPSCPGSEHPTFSQLLAGAMASPLAKSHTLLPENQLARNNFEEQGLEGCDQNDKNLGFKKNRPMTLMVSNSPYFIAPFGFSSSGWLNSPGFFSPLQSPFGMSHQQALAHVTAQAALSQSYLQTPQGTSIQVLGHEVPIEPKESSAQVSQSEDKPPSDGYNWRKYGQKMLKASECPRSYYKCTHLKCPVKKKVERTIEGHITEVMYKGQHNHELPQPSNRRRLSCAEDGPGPDCSKVRPDAEIEESSERVSAEKASELPVSKRSDEIDVSAIATDEGRHDDEANVKRMKTTTTEAPDLTSLHKAVSESKIIVQTRSEVDILNDGFKWRKYGQKMVKGNHHPRSYYRCTYPGCNVRKHVERASMDPKSVITTYEGKHNHEIPIIARNRSHSTAQDHNNNNSDTHRLKEQEENIAISRPSSLHEKVAFQNNKEIPVCGQVKEAQSVA